ncbi:hypothetical protein PPL_08730 [Heterostelium album PN500]|uniref:Uncharacterized protein n=1 Tax=Heterostelium pallidum (strain ATCC 26659 / Pp 5 / PN500) TaxID=670386 RepID=D3BJK2_HETP5|nr:hypothetical protein PPL_08730 [Heterostelium album PN500]EFA78082.1 hypothetical protein PPL_08730 [Heterostelium album PN500]|eukprot:XP_020430209.1 hypothetical protein PPL_08730 [Heterostelium album PN500]
MYKINHFDKDINDSLNEYSTKHNLPTILTSHLNISLLAQKRRFKEAHQQFQVMTDKRPRTYQVATELFLQKHSYSKLVASRLRFIWVEPTLEDLEWYLGISLSYNQVNQFTLSLVTAALAKDSGNSKIGQSIIKQYVARENQVLTNDGQWNVFSRLMKALPNEKEQIQFFKHISQHQLNTSDLKLELPFKLNENTQDINELLTDTTTSNQTNNKTTTPPLSPSTINYITDNFINHKVIHCVSSYIGS